MQKKESKNHHCKGRQIIDAGGADGEGQWSGKAAALLAQMQHYYSQEKHRGKADQKEDKNCREQTTNPSNNKMYRCNTIIHRKNPINQIKNSQSKQPSNQMKKCKNATQLFTGKKQPTK